ncbi:AMP-binding enzyme [Nonomuraea dietziae]|uniref:AMP-binding enzyme n=1 Tax=Nonomuraea dietziae TaxID=65515 RepID=UPI00337F5A5C
MAKALGPIAKPRQILVVPELPKTRSGKIMRRLLRDVAENRSVGDVTTLADSTVMNLISEKLPQREVRRLTSSIRRAGGFLRPFGTPGGAHGGPGPQADPTGANVAEVLQNAGYGKRG